MKKSILSFLSIVVLIFFITSCSQSIEEQEVKPSKVKVDMANKGAWLQSIISKHNQNKGSRTATLCGSGTGYLGHLGTLGCATTALNVPSNFECAYFSAEAGFSYSTEWALWREYVFKDNSGNPNTPDAHLYVVKEDGALISYGFNNTVNGYGGSQNLSLGTIFYVVIIKTSPGDGSYRLDTFPYLTKESCSDNF